MVEGKSEMKSLVDSGICVYVYSGPEAYKATTSNASPHIFSQREVPSAEGCT